MDKQVPFYHKITRRLVSTKPAAWLLSRFAHLIDRFLLSRTNGRYSAAVILTGMPIINLTTIGARSGRPRKVPLLSIPDGKNIILIASNWGQQHHPGWYHNIRSNPEVQVESQAGAPSYEAREVMGEERERYWETAVEYYPGYKAYKKWAKEREIPVIVLTPTDTK
jgi:deazaflavin-dependent oxidoreductase (nitroreductase family)